MWQITSLTINGKSDQTAFLFGGQPGKETIGKPGPLGPEGASYILALPGLGYIKLTDIGPARGGPGDWGVRVSNASSDWTYGGGGQAQVTINSDGTYTISGGSNSVSGKLVSWQ